MKTLVLISLFCGLGLSIRAQTKLGSLRKELPSPFVGNKIDSGAQTIVHLPDSLFPSFQKIDSSAQIKEAASKGITVYNNQDELMKAIGN